LGQYFTLLFQCVSAKVKQAGGCQQQQDALERTLFERNPADNCLYEGGALCQVTQPIQSFNQAVFNAIAQTGLQDNNGFQQK
jgi:hypothetical protein